MGSQVTLEIPVTGMHCAACVGRVQHAVEGEGVSSAVVNLMTNSATVKFDPRSRIMNVTRPTCSPRSMTNIADGNRAEPAVHRTVGFAFQAGWEERSGLALA